MNTANIEQKTEKEEPWINLSGCNSCVNTDICDRLGSCLLLHINNHIPEFNKKKRKLVQRFRTCAPITGDHEKFENTIWDIIDQYKPKITGEDKRNKEELEPEIRLTKLEKMFIDSLNKPRP